jgi:hypothetical protein
VGADFLVQFEKAFYSVPSAHIGKRVVVLGTLQRVRIFDGIIECCPPALISEIGTKTPG